MNRLNQAFTVTSVLVLLVTMERFSFTTTILLQPDSFIRLHELIQGPILLTLFLVVSTFILKEITDQFKTLRYALLALFVVGAYLYGLGEGWHEVTSFTLNQYCDVQQIPDELCGGLFINDYYTGNVLFLIGAIAMATALMLLERGNPEPCLGQPKSRDRCREQLHLLVHVLRVRCIRRRPGRPVLHRRADADLTRTADGSGAALAPTSVY